MPDDVLHDHDGVVHQNADGKNQREQRNAIQRKSVEIKNQQCQCERGRNGQRHDDGFAPAEHEQDEHRHAHHRKQHVPEQFVGFILRRHPVVTGDANLHIAGNDVALERVHLL